MSRAWRHHHRSVSISLKEATEALSSLLASSAWRINIVYQRLRLASSAMA
jgi:hypothetical protein